MFKLWKYLVRISLNIGKKTYINYVLITKEKVVFWVLEELVLRAAENFLILKDPPWDLGIIIPLSLSSKPHWLMITNLGGEREGGIEIYRQIDRVKDSSKTR